MSLTSSSRTPSPDDSNRRPFGTFVQETNSDMLATPSMDTSAVGGASSGAAS